MEPLCAKFASMNRPKVYITSNEIPAAGLDLLREKCELKMNKDVLKLRREDILNGVAGVDAAFWSSKVRLDKEILDAAGPQMKVVATMSVGVDHIDVEELKSRGIKLGNTPGVLNDAVANMAVLLALSASRRTHEGRKCIENSAWKDGVQWMLGMDIEGSTVGIVGLGGVGQAIAKRLKAFKIAKFLYCGHKEKKEAKQLDAEFVSFDTLLPKSDFVIISCPLTNETKGMFNLEAFKKMKRTAVLVNIGRGPIVVQEDLVKALKEGLIFAAGLDVMTPEPLPADNELLQLPNCVLVPHLGSATINTRNAMARLTAENILKGLAGEEMVTPVC